MRTLELLLPALFPSWRFFRDIAPSPRVECRTGPDAPWLELRPRPAHLSLTALAGRLIWNPGWNSYLYLVSCAEQVVIGTAPTAEARLHGHIAALSEGSVAEVRLVFVHREGNDLVREVDYAAPHRVLSAPE